MSILELIDTVDASDDYSRSDADSALYSNVIGQLAKEKTFTVKDPRGIYSPFAATSQLSRLGWRRGRIIEKNTDGNTLFDGIINQIGQVYEGAIRRVNVQARDPLGVLMDWVVTLCDSTSYSGFLVNKSGDYAAGATNEVIVDTGTGTIPQNSVVSFVAGGVPSYRVVSSTSTTITLDRYNEAMISNNAPVYVYIPVMLTAAGALKRILNTVGITTLTANFDIINSSDITASRYIWFNIRQEHQVKLRDIIQLICEMGDLYLSVNRLGIVNVRRGMAYDGQPITKRITGAEIILPSEDIFDRSRLIIGYDLIYAVPTQTVTIGGIVTPLAGSVAITSGSVSSLNLTEYAGTNYRQTIQAKSNGLNDYYAVYGSQATADYFGTNVINYFGHERRQKKFALKKNRSGQPFNNYDISLFSDFLLSCSTSIKDNYVNEPCTVLSYSKSSNLSRYDSVLVELTNNPWPKI